MKYIALFRGINVGGKNKLPMKALKEIIESLGYTNVKTYIQSGNVLFSSAASKAKSFPRSVGKAIDDLYGFEPDILVLTLEELEKAINKSRFPVSEGKSLHLYFLSSFPTKPDLEGITRLQAESEKCKLLDSVFYLYAPDGVGRSKLAARIEKLLGVKATARNGNTVRALIEMAREE